MAGAIFRFATSHPPFAQLLPRQIRACSGILYPTLHASYLVRENSRQHTMSGAHGGRRRHFKGNKRSKRDEEVELGLKKHEKHVVGKK
jgi:hypothetical protein